MRFSTRSIAVIAALSVSSPSLADGEPWREARSPRFRIITSHAGRLCACWTVRFSGGRSSWETSSPTSISGGGRKRIGSFSSTSASCRISSGAWKHYLGLKLLNEFHRFLHAHGDGVEIGSGDFQFLRAA